MSGSPVYVTGRLGTDFLRRIRQLLPDAVERAIYKTRDELEPYLEDVTIVPRDTGRLQESVAWFISPGQITFRWSAVDPDTGFNYAKLRDLLGGKFAPPDFSGRLLGIAKELLMKNLVIELQGMSGP